MISSWTSLRFCHIGKELNCRQEPTDCQYPSHCLFTLLLRTHRLSPPSCFFIITYTSIHPVMINFLQLADGFPECWNWVQDTTLEFGNYLFTDYTTLLLNT